MNEQKVKEAIKTMEILLDIAKSYSDATEDVVHKEMVESIETAIEAMEKQLPKKPESVVDAYNYTIGEYRIGKCPNCGSEVLDVFDVCLECRQKLDWNE